MATRRYLAVCMLLIISVPGCGEKDSDSADVSGHRARLLTVLDLSDPGYRDELLGEVASSAAEDGEVAVVKEAVAAISNVSARDAIAAEAAYALAESGDAAAAREVANLIDNASDRDDVLGGIADSE